MMTPATMTALPSANRVAMCFMDIQSSVLTASSDKFSPYTGVGERNLRPGSSALLRCGFNAKGATDHLQPLAHAEQPQSWIMFGLHDALRLKGFAIVFDF